MNRFHRLFLMPLHAFLCCCCFFRFNIPCECINGLVVLISHVYWLMQNMKLRRRMCECLIWWQLGTSYMFWASEISFNKPKDCLTLNLLLLIFTSNFCFPNTYTKRIAQHFFYEMEFLSAKTLCSNLTKYSDRRTESLIAIDSAHLHKQHFLFKPR